MGVADARRLLANVPTYMIFDDHEITDDWYINDEWKRTVLEEKPIGRRAIANGLAGFWAFQAWGNAPDAFSRAFINAVTQHLYPPSAPIGSDRQPDKFERTLIDFHDWAFCAPTSPRALFLDTRTRRAAGEVGSSPDPRRRPARLVSDEAWTACKDLVRAERVRPGEALILVVPTPVYNVPLIEFGQELITSRSLTLFRAKDAEAWRLNRRNMIDLFEFLVDLAPSVAIILSGDVHYASAACALIRARHTELRVAQFTSSALKNSPGRGPDIAGLISHRSSFRLFWWRGDGDIVSMPEPGRGSRHRPADFDEMVRMEAFNARSPGTASPGAHWDSPVDWGTMPSGPFGPPVEPPEPIRVIYESNIGLLAARDREVEHRLLVGGGQEKLPVRYDVAKWPVEP
jgi:hypothetical protein